MAFDGVFIHNLINELSPLVVFKKVSKVQAINDDEYALVLSNKETLILSCNKNFSHFRLSCDIKNTKNHFGQVLKKYFEGAFIMSFTQIENDRIVKLSVEKNDELGYNTTYSLYFEVTGKTANIIICDDKDIIIEALHKHYDIEGRMIVGGATYSPLESCQINPYSIKESNASLNENIYQGVSRFLFTEMCFRESVTKVLNSPIIPTLYLGKKLQFSCFSYKHINSERKEFSTLNDLLEEYISSSSFSSVSDEEGKVLNYVNHELEKLDQKLIKQIKEQENAKDYSLLEKKANLLTLNIDKIKPYSKTLVVNDEDGNNIEIEINPKVIPTENINIYYSKIKKQKRAIEEIGIQIENTNKEIAYFKEILEQVKISSSSSLKEIAKELGLVKKDITTSKPAYIRYIDEDGNMIFVGKNNIQNDYLTNKLASSNDYFFHVTSYPGCHVIFKGTLTDKALKLASTICAYHSKMTSTVSIDYTLVKYVKKIKGMKGSFVKYTNQHTAYATGDIDYIKEHAKVLN